MNFLKIICILSAYLNAQSYIVGPEKEIKEHSKYPIFKKNDDFQKANLVIVIHEDNEFIKHPLRPSRNVFGYTKYIIVIYQNEKLIYKKTFRLSSFDGSKRNLVSFNEKQHIENRKKIVQYAFDILTLVEYSEKNKISKNLKNIKIKEPTSNFIVFYENGKIKGLNLNLKDFNYELKIIEKLDVIPSILNKHDIKLIKAERIYNHGVYSYITIENTIIKLPNKKYYENLYKTLLKIEIIYLMNKNIFKKDNSIFFTEFDKLANKSIEELIKTKKNYKKKDKGTYV